jgi:hypothetical protein
MVMKHMLTTTALALALAYPAMSFAADPALNSSSIKSEKLIHAALRNPQGDKLGDVEGVLLDKDGQTRAIVVDVGGFLEMGEHRVVLNWADVQVTNGGEKVVSSYSKKQLKALPEYKYPDQARRDTAYYDPNWSPTAVRVSAAHAYSGQELAKDAKVSMVDARAIALKAHPGKITDEELENEGGGSGLRYSFDIKSGNKTFEVGVDAKTGKVLENAVEGKNPD